MEISKFSRYDSVAVWGRKDSNFSKNLNIKELEDLRIDKIEGYFRNSYEYGKNNNHMFFNKEWINNLTDDYIIVGSDPGKDGKNVDKFHSFHWKINSNDYRLASALYGTKFWHCFMTNLSDDCETPSEKIVLYLEDVQKLLKKINLLGINSNAKIIAIGQNTFNAFKKYRDGRNDISSDNFHSKVPKPIKVDNHWVSYIPHYSGNNNGKRTNDWNTQKINKRIIKFEEL